MGKSLSSVRDGAKLARCARVLRALTSILCACAEIREIRQPLARRRVSYDLCDTVYNPVGCSDLSRLRAAIKIV